MVCFKSLSKPSKVYVSKAFQNHQEFRTLMFIPSFDVFFDLVFGYFLCSC
jgi:hypothetical protein